MSLAPAGAPRAFLTRGRRRREHVHLVARLLAVGIVVLVVLAAGMAVRGAASEPKPHGLTPELTSRFEKARSAAAERGLDLVIGSGWRSADAQQRLFDEAVDTYGSDEAAMRWVLPPEKSAHVLGKAIDVTPPKAAAWLTKHGATYGLCRVYVNEPWHFEAIVEPGEKCPAPREDAAAG